MLNRKLTGQPHQSRGFSLIEVLVSVVILSFGLLGVAALQVNTMKNNQSSYQRTQAVMLSYFMFDVMRANRPDALANNYNIALPVGYSPSDPSTCPVPATVGSLVANDIQFWMQSIKDVVGPSGCGEVNCAGGDCTVRIHWGDDRATGGATQQTFEVRTRL